MSHKLSLSSAILGVFAILSATEAHATCNLEGEQALGSVCMVAFDFCPRGYAEMNGQLLNVNEFQSLAGLLGTTYGGNGRSTFGLPDMRGRTVVGVGTGPGLTPVFHGQIRGMENVTPTVEHMPAHKHYIELPRQRLTVSEVEVGLPNGNGSVKVLGQDEEGDPFVVTSTGGNVPQYNIPPQAALTYCIAVQGRYPTRQ